MKLQPSGGRHHGGGRFCDPSAKNRFFALRAKTALQRVGYWMKPGSLCHHCRHRLLLSWLTMHVKIICLSVVVGCGQKKYVMESEMVKIIDHRGSKVKVSWNDGEDTWEELCEMKKEAKDLLAKYCSEKGLENDREWDSVESYQREKKREWFARLQDFVADTRLLREYDRLTTALHSEFKRCRKQGDMETMITFGRAFKESIDIRKHGGRVHLPIDLQSRIKEKALKKYLY